MFRRLGLSSELCKALSEKGISTPTEIQAKAIQAGLNGTNFIARAPTGTGKTLSYLLPLFDKLKKDELNPDTLRKPHRPRAIVVVPSRELGLQVAGVAKHLSHYSKCITGLVTGGSSKKKQKDILTQPVDLLIATPGRLAVFLDMKQVFMSNLKYVVVDEADTLYDKSAGFRENMEQALLPAKAAAKHRQIDLQYMFVGATIDPTVQKVLQAQAPNVQLITSSQTKPESIEQEFIRVKGDKFIALRNVIDRQKRTIIFCNNTKSCQATEHMLREHEYHTTTALHGEMPPIARQTSMKEFIASDSGILVCTDLAARGLDIDNVDHVILFDLPKTETEYMHRIGRTGRAGKYGKATSLVTKYDQQLVNKLTNNRPTAPSSPTKQKSIRKPRIRLQAADRRKRS